MNGSSGNGDKGFEKRLSRALKARLGPQASAPAAGTCLDAETLSAWADGVLDTHERAAVEAHAAGCARCQALLAAMIGSAPPPPLTRAWWRMPVLKWLAPLAAAATAVAVWALVPRRPDLRSGPPVVAPAHETASAPASVGSRRSESPAVGGRRSESPAAERQLANQAAPGAPGATAVTSATAQAAADAVEAAKAPAALQRSEPQAAAPKGAVAEAPAPVPLLNRDTIARALRREGQVKEEVQVSEIVAGSGPGTRWRPGSGGLVERSTDGGVTWERQQTGASIEFIGGSAPSPLVCWLVGRGGVVLLQTDGRSWRRVAFPEATELVSIQAVDDKTATIITADGRAFRTTDGGLTWTGPPGA